MKFKKLAKLIHEMPDFELQGSKYKTSEGKDIKDFGEDQVEENIIVYYIERHPLMPPNKFLVYFLDSAESANEMKAGDITPPYIHVANLTTSPFVALWRMKSTDKRVLGTIQGHLGGDDLDTIYVDFMTVRSNARRQNVNSQMINALKKEWPDKKIEYVDLTDQGKKFKAKYESP